MGINEQEHEFIRDMNHCLFYETKVTNVCVRLPDAKPAPYQTPGSKGKTCHLLITCQRE
jgi:hypothetical protein